MSVLGYESYRDTGVDWLGAVPSHWRVRRLKHIADAFPSNVDKKEYDEGTPIRLCNYTNVYYSDVIFDDPDFMVATATPAQIEKFTLRAGDTIITKDSETAADIAMAAYVPDDLPGVVCGYHLSMIRPHQGTSGAFIKRYFDSAFAKASVAVRANGLTRVGLGQYAVDNLQVPVPPFDEQVAIVSFLDREVGKIDDLVEAQRRLMFLLKEKQQAVVSHSVTKGLAPSAPMKNTGIEWLGQVPGHWELERAKLIFSRSDLPPPEEAEVVTCFRDGQVTLRRNRREDGFTFAVLEVGYQGIMPGQLVLHSMDAFAGAIGVSDSAGKCSPEYLVCDPRDDQTEPGYYGLLLRLMALRGFVLAVCPSVRERAPRIRFPDFGDLLLPRPPKAEQAAIIEHIARETERLRNLRKAAEKAIALLQERRATLISAAVTGKIDVRGLVREEAEAA